MPACSETPRSGKAARCAVCDGKFGLVRHYSWRTQLCSKKCVDCFSRTERPQLVALAPNHLKPGAREPREGSMPAVNHTVSGGADAHHRMADPLICVKGRKKWMIPGMTCSAPWCILLALLSATVSPTRSFSQGTSEQRIACTPDVLRLCSAFIPNADEITSCLKEKNAELSDACRTAFEPATTQLPGVSDGANVRKRTAR
jgi:hypothetical protein